ncbi:TetR/AcrR family transcriptional regulator [Fodinicola feengrottensis]|uniref:TetR/AcrR family transcriptional regulator n=1 Tax=Fodinicola feengrottensis TaxID=435914 RepID=UPI0013D108A7|nr:TetR/AcrR family transcriptional regulator [Fodinicola feengrottensis]
MRQEGSLARTHEGEPGLPRGRSRLPAARVRAAQRERIIRAIVAVVAENGYAAATIADVVRNAKVSRAAFYAHFSDKEDCFLEATQEGGRLMIGHIVAATHGLADDVSPEQAMRVACRALLEFLIAEPAFAQVFYVEMPGAGRVARDRIDASRHRFAHLNRAWHQRARAVDPSCPQVPEHAYLAAVGATTVVRATVHSGRFDALAELEDSLVALHLALLAAKAWTKGTP